MADPCTKFEVSSLTVAEILHGVGVKFYKWSLDTEHAPFRGDFFIGRMGLAMVNQCTKFDLYEVHPLRSYEWQCKVQKMGWFGVIRGHSRSRAMPPFDRAHTTSYSTIIESIIENILPFSRYSRLFVESRRF